MSVPGFVPEDYPFGLSDSELQAEISKVTGRLAGGDTVRWAPLLQLGQSELQNRRSNRETRLSNMTSRRIACAALVVSIFSLVFTGVAAYFAHDAARTSARWEIRQSAQLEALRQEAAGTRVGVENLVATAAKVAAVTRPPRSRR